MDFEPGIKVTDVAALRAAGVDLDRVAEILVSAYCEQILARGFFHADPHPGNLLVQPGPAGPRVVFLDFGLAKELPESFRAGVLDFAAALLRGDPDAMAAAMGRLGFETRDDSQAGLQDIARFVLDAAQRVRAQATVDRELAEALRAELPRRIRENPLVRVPVAPRARRSRGRPALGPDPQPRDARRSGARDPALRIRDETLVALAVSGAREGEKRHARALRRLAHRELHGVEGPALARSTRSGAPRAPDRVTSLVSTTL